MLVWKPPALKIFLISLAIGAALMLVFQFFMYLESARNVGLMIAGLVMLGWDLRYRQSVGVRWDDLSVSSFFLFLPTSLVGGLIVISFLIASLVSPTFSLFPQTYGLPGEMRGIVLRTAGNGSRIISAQQGSAEFAELWCVVTENNGGLERWTVYENRISRAHFSIDFTNYNCTIWDGSPPPSSP